MSRTVYEATGATEDGAMIVLDTPLPIRGRVKVQVEVEDRAAKREAVLQAIRARQQARGHQPLSREEIDAYLCESRTEDERAKNLPR